MSRREPARPQPVTVAEARARVSRKVTAHQRGWAVGFDFTPIVVRLRPPTEAQAQTDIPATVEWIKRWQDTADAGSAPGAGSGSGMHVEFVERRWPGLGTQRLPSLLRLESPEAAAGFVGGAAQFLHLLERAAQVLEWLASARGRGADDRRLVRSHLGGLVDLDDDDFGRLVSVLDWLVDHPDSGMYIRQLPIAGVDSKWLEGHRTLVTGLVLAVTGRAGLGLRSAEPRVRVRFLHPELWISGLEDIEAPASRVQTLAVPQAVSAVLVVENQESFIALPTDGSLGRMIAVYGGGYAASVVADLPWLAGRRLLYWGDVDSHGFGILNRFRTHQGHAESVLMDQETFEAFSALAVPEPTPLRVEPEHLEALTPSERDVYRNLREAGNLRLEQERIGWPYVLERLSYATSRGDSNGAN